MDLYQLDLSTVVNKHIGETKKNLVRAVSPALKTGREAAHR
jgi:hypothetical protein